MKNTQREAAKAWELCDYPPPAWDGGARETHVVFDLSMKALKVVVYVVTFLVVLVCGVLAQGSLLFMTSQLRTNRSVTFCNNSLGRAGHFEASSHGLERSAWTWCLLLAFSIPEVGVLLNSLRQCFRSRTWRRPAILDFLSVMVVETLHTAGLAVLLFAVLPDLDVVEGVVITACVHVVPSVLSLLSITKAETSDVLCKFVDVVAMLVQALGLFTWPFLRADGGKGLWLVPISLFCISCTWWENFIPKNSMLGVSKTLWRLKSRLSRCRSFAYIFVSIWKILFFFVLTLAAVNFREGNINSLFGHSSLGLSPYKIKISETTSSSSELKDMTHLSTAFDEFETQDSAASYILLLNVSSALLCYIFGNFACKLQMQRFSFALPVFLTTPVTLAALISFTSLRQQDPCYFKHTIPDHLFFATLDHLSTTKVWALVVLVLSQVWITRHIWCPEDERMSSTAQLFVLPMYSALLINQTQGLNRRKHYQSNHNTEEATEAEMQTDTSGTCVHGGRTTCTPQVYACATLWHETAGEMREVLKSVLRLDADHCARTVTQQHLQAVDPDFFDLETHIFFDDAFQPCAEGEDSHQVNSYVKVMVEALDEAVTQVHGGGLQLEVPIKYLTPYGGRLVWTLPGGTRLVVHLKGKNQIRLKKRWSQVMYMYYLLGHRLMERGICVELKEELAMNTFLLSMDGDMAFQPAAVHALVTEMRIDRNLAVTCGRIHPFGSGPMVWFQKFEYGMGQWLHKATENLIGCVLCCPGAFSLFRGKVLMNDNLMVKYTAQSTLARHYVQQDQGEDRWLCSLLLQKGYRTRYVGNSKAYTHCPEDFNDFFIQRRRWVTSTISNLVELLRNCRTAVRINDNISVFYILYEIVIMNVMILGPGSIFLMFVGVIKAAFHIDYWTSFNFNLSLMLIFIVICFVCKSEHQLLAAQALSLIYTLVMIGVHLRTSLPWREEATTLSTLLFVFFATSFLLAVVFLPHHLKRVMPAIVYFFYSPALYLILIPYSIINLNVVSWGTREVIVQDCGQTPETDEKKALRKRCKFVSSVARLLSCFKITLRRSTVRKVNLVFSLIDKVKKVFNIQSEVCDVEQPTQKLTSNGNTNRASKYQEHIYIKEKNLTETDSMDLDKEFNFLLQTRRMSRDYIPESVVKKSGEIKSCWINDPSLGGSVEELSSGEIQFWKDLLQKYLFPVNVSKNKKERVAADLIVLRNSSVLVILVMNGLFVLIMILVQVKGHITSNQEDSDLNDTSNTGLISQVYSQLVSFVLMYFFATLFVIQMTSLVIDQFSTVLNLLASTELTSWFKHKNTKRNHKSLKKSQAVLIEDWLQKLTEDNVVSCEDQEHDNDETNDKNILAKEVKQRNVSLSELYRRRILKIQLEQDNERPGLQGTNRTSVEASVLRETAKDSKEHKSHHNTYKMTRDTSKNKEHHDNSVFSKKVK